jgi:hypothetical protein
LPLGVLVYQTQAADVRAMGTHLSKLQVEEAELLAEFISARLTKSALEILELLGIVKESAEAPELDPNLDTNEAETIRAAEALARRHLRRR